MSTRVTAGASARNGWRNQDQVVERGAGRASDAHGAHELRLFPTGQTIGDERSALRALLGHLGEAAQRVNG